MMNSKNETSEFELTGRHVAAIMIGFFAVIIVVNFTMATFANKTWTGLVVSNSYVASQKFNGELEEAKAQRAKGWQSDIAYEDGVLTFNLRGAERELIQIDNAQLAIGRPAFEQQDRTVNLVEGESGSHVAKLDLGQGMWQGQLTAEVEGQGYRRDFRLYVNAENKARLDP